MSRNSLTRRVVAAVVGLELLCAGAFSGVALWHEQRSRLHAFDVLLEGRSDSLLGAVQDAEDPADNVTIDPDELKIPDEDVYAVYNRGGQLLPGASAASARAVSRSHEGFRFERLGGQEYRILQKNGLRIIDREENHGIGLRRPVTILYGAPTAGLWKEIFRAASFYVVVSMLLVGVTTLLLILLIRRLLRPVSELAVAASHISPTALEFTPPASAMALGELRPLAQSLQATMQRLREAFDAEHRFVGDAAHELKTALAVLHSTIQLQLLRQRTPEEYQRGLNHILADSERAEGLISRMLTLARFEERANLKTEQLANGDLIANTLQTLETLAAVQGIQLTHRLNCDFSLAIAPESLHSLVSNLVVNAIQHSASGSCVEIRLTNDPDRNVSTLEVEDHGEGISEASLPHVFERFYREDTSRSRETGGAGLGLAICKSIVDSVGGSLMILSKKGVGTTVRAQLPHKLTRVATS